MSQQKPRFRACIGVFGTLVHFFKQLEGWHIYLLETRISTENSQMDKSYLKGVLKPPGYIE